MIRGFIVHDNHSHKRNHICAWYIFEKKKPQLVITWMDQVVILCDIGRWFVGGVCVELTSLHALHDLLQRTPELPLALLISGKQDWWICVIFFFFCKFDQNTNLLLLRERIQTQRNAHDNIHQDPRPACRDLRGLSSLRLIRDQSCWWTECYDDRVLLAFVIRRMVYTFRVVLCAFGMKCRRRRSHTGR